MKKKILIDYLATTFYVMTFLKNLAETFKVGFWILPQILFLARDMFFGSSIFFRKVFFSFSQPLYVNKPKK